MKILYTLCYDTKVIKDGNSKIGELIEYDILGLEIEYTRGRKMLCGMEKSLTEKIPNLDTPLNTVGRKMNAPCQPGFTIENKDIEMDELEYNTRVKKMHSFSANYVRNLLRRAKQYEISIPDNAICDILLNGLKGPYKTLQSKYALDDSNKSMSAILQDIQRLYHLHGPTPNTPSNKSNSGQQSKRSSSTVKTDSKNSTNAFLNKDSKSKPGTSIRNTKQPNYNKKRIEKAQNISNDKQIHIPPPNDCLLYTSRCV